MVKVIVWDQENGREHSSLMAGELHHDLYDIVHSLTDDAQRIVVSPLMYTVLVSGRVWFGEDGLYQGGEKRDGVVGYINDIPVTIDPYDGAGHALIYSKDQLTVVEARNVGFI